MEPFLPISLAEALYLLVPWIALTTPARPPQLSDPSLRDTAVRKILCRTVPQPR